MKTPDAIRVAVIEAVKAMIKGSAPIERMTSRDAMQLVEFVATAAIGVVLARIAAEMRQQTFDESQAGGACSDALSIARELGYRAGNNDFARRWAKLLDEAVHRA